MRKAFVLLALLGLTSSLWAADPIIGTWKLKSSNDENLKESVNAYREIEEDMIELSDKDILNDGSSETSKWVWPKEGGIVKCISSKIEEELLFVEILVEPGHWYVSIMANGRQVAMYSKEISPDGKTLKQTHKGINEQGKEVNVIRVYERQ